MKFLQLNSLKENYLIKPLAYLFWVLRARKVGGDLDDWLKAEYIINCLMGAGLAIVGIFGLVKFGLRYFLMCAVLIGAIFSKKKKVYG